MSYFHVLLLILELAAFLYCCRYLMQYYLAHLRHKRALEEMARVADSATMEKYRWKEHASDLAHVDEQQLADHIRNSLKADIVKAIEE